MLRHIRLLLVAAVVLIGAHAGALAQAVPGHGYDHPGAATTPSASFSLTSAITPEQSAANPGAIIIGDRRFLAAEEAGGLISMDEAVARGAAHVSGEGTMMVTPRGNYQFVGNEFTNAAGQTQRNIARFDVTNLRPTERPHLNLEVQINGTTQQGLDPHTLIDPSTIRPGDVP